MPDTEKKIERMVEVARMYYEHNLTQSQIAQRLGVSRPLVSMLLSEARATGIVTIQINPVENAQQLAAQHIQQLFPHIRAIVLPDAASSDATDDAVAQTACLHFLKPDGATHSIGVGWGSMLSRLASCDGLQGESPSSSSGCLFPLVGGIKASYRGYHTNEITRITSQKWNYEAHYLYFPAFFDSRQDLEYIKQMEEYQRINTLWSRMDTTILSISNFPSYPDLGVEYRYGKQLLHHRCVGRILAHHFDIHGTVIPPAVDNVMQASLEQLSQASNTVAMCSALLKPESVIGALRTGAIHTVILCQSLAQQVVAAACSC